MIRSFPIEVLAHRAVLRTPEPLAALLDECLAGIKSSVVESTSDETIDLLPIDDEYWTMAASGAAGVRQDRPGRLLARLLEHLNRAAARSVADDVPFHAAAVAKPDGRVVLLAGASGSGKSTLCAAAVMSGWRLVAEEVAAVDPDSRMVRPYHRPVGLRPGGAAALGIVPPPGPWFEEVYPWCPASSALCDGGRLAAIVLVARGDVAAPPSTLRPALALTELIRHVVIPDDDRVAAGFHRVAGLVRDVPVHHVTYGTPAEGVAALDRLVQS